MKFTKQSRKNININQPDPFEIKVILGVFIVFSLILVANMLLGSSLPLLATGLGWLWYLMPGLVLSFALVRPLPLWERLPVAFVLTIGLSTPITMAAILFRVSLPVFILLHAAMLLFSGLILLLTNSRDHPLKFNFLSRIKTFKPSAETLKQAIVPLILMAAILSGFLIFFSYDWPLHGDDIAGLSIFSEVIQQNRITGTEPFHGTDIPSTPRNELIVWTYMEILVNKVANVYPPEFIINSRPILVFMAVLSFFTFLRHYFKEKRIPLFLLNIWLIYLLATTASDGTGSNMITRIFQDKFVGWFVVIPIVLVTMLWFIKTPSFLNLLLFGVVVFGASMVHPITLVQAMILIGGFGIVHLGVEKSRNTWKSFLLISVVLLLSLSIPLIQFLRYSGYFPLELVGLDDVVELGRLNSSVNRYRLWLLNGDRLILHPAVFLQPVIIAAYLVFPFIFRRKKDHHAAHLLGGTLLLLPILLYFPPFAYLVGKVVTPYLLWRLAWPIPVLAVLTLGWGLWLLLEKPIQRFETNETGSRIKPIIYAGIIIIIAAMAMPNITRGLRNHFEKRAGIKYSTCSRAENVLFFLDNLASKNDMNILSSQNLNFCIPGYAGLANVVEFRGYGTVNRLSEDYLPDSLLRLEDVDYFTSAVLIDDQIIEILTRYDIDYVLVEKDNMDLELQFKYLNGYFVRLYEDADFSLFKVKSPIIPSPIVEANSNLRSYQFDSAREKFSQISQEEPDNVLAHLGKGLVYEGSGDIELAIDSYQQAAIFAINEPGVYAHLANAYVIKGDYQKAIETYRLISAFTKNRYSIYERLGQIYVQTDNEGQAKKYFELAASLKAQKGTAAYYLVLGDLYKSMDILGETIHFYDEAVTIEDAPDNLLRLARALSSSGRDKKAIEVYRRAIDQDRWGYHSHLDLGFLFMKQGRVDEAINELETAIRLRPTGISAYILLGQAIRENSGAEIAISRMEELKALNDILPGPYRSKAMLLFAKGNLESALDELDFNLNVQPKSAAIKSAQGFILLADRQFEAAQSAFDQVLSFDPNSISAHIGLSIVYMTQTQYELETNHLVQIVRLNPLEAWPHLLLAQSYMHQGNIEEASREIELAVGLEPANIAGYLARGELLSSQMNFERAIQDYSAVLEVDPHNIEALRGLGNVYQKMGEVDQAEKIYLLASEIDETSIFARIKLAEIYREQGRIDEAISLEEAAYALSPDSDLVVTKLAQTYRLQGRIEEAKTLYEQVISRETDKVYAYAALAQLMAEEENDQYKLYALFSKLVQENTESAEAYLNAGIFSMSQAHYEQAEHLLHVSLGLEDVSIQNYLVLSELYQKQGHWDLALSTLQSTISQFPKSVIGLNSLAEFYLNQGNLEKAAQYFDDALELDPGLISALVGKSKIELINGNFEGAEKILKGAIYENQHSPQLDVALANLYETNGHPSMAKTYYEQAMLTNPKDIFYYEPMAQFYLRQKEFENAHLILQDALSLFGSKFEIYLSLGDLYLAQGEHDRAIQALNSASEIDRSDVRPYLALSDVFWSMGKWDAAIETLDSALYIEPASVSANLKMGRFCKMLSLEEEAINYFSRAVALDRSQANSLIELARISKNNKDLKQAFTYLEQAIEIDPGNITPYTELAGIHLLLGNAEAAETVVSLAIEKSPDKNGAYLAQASFYENQQNWDLAEAAYENAWAMTSYAKKSGINLVHFLFKRNDLEKALSVLDQLEETYGPDSEISVEFGNIYLAEADWKQALSAYNQAKDLDETALAGYKGLVKTYNILGDQESVIDEYRQALEMVNEKSDVYYNLGVELQNRGDFSEAYQAFQEVLQIEPMHAESLLAVEQLNTIMDNPQVDLTGHIQYALQTSSEDAFITIAKLLQFRGEWPSSLSWIRKALESDPYNHENWLLLGDYYQKVGQLDKALEAFDEAKSLQPNSFDAYMALGSVLVDQGRVEEGKNYFQNAIEISPGKIEGFSSLAKAYQLMGDPDEAIAVAHEGLASVPGDYRGYQDLYDLMIEIDPDQYQQADEVIQQALVKFPGISNLYAIRARIYSDLVLAKREKIDTLKAQERMSYYWLNQLLERAETAETRSQSRVIAARIEEAKQQYDSYHNQVLALRQENETSDPNYEMALMYYDTALLLDPYNESAIIGKGRLITSNDSKEETLSFVEQGYKNQPYSSSIGVYLGSMYNNFGLQNEAISVFKQILLTEPGNLVARIGLLAAYDTAPQLSVSQAAEYVQMNALRFPFLVENLRILESVKSN